MIPNVLMENMQQILCKGKEVCFKVERDAQLVCTHYENDVVYDLIATGGGGVVAPIMTLKQN